MTNEAIIRDRLDSAINFTVADGTGITKGAVLKLTDPRTASASDGAGDVIAGIAARDKIASDGRTSLSVFRKGIFDMVASGAISVGSSVASAGAVNQVLTTVGTAYSGAAIIGQALETASDGEVFQVYVNVGGAK